MRPQKLAATRLIRHTIVPDHAGPIVYRDGEVHSRVKEAYDFSSMPAVHVLSRGAVRVAYSVVGIWCEAGHEHATVRIGEKPTPYDGLPIVQLACRQAARLRLGIPLLSEESENEFLASCAPVGKRPESRMVTAKRVARDVAKTLPRASKSRAA